MCIFSLKIILMRLALFSVVLFICNPLFSQDFVKHRILKNKHQSSETYQSMTFNGSWCWFSDPRAVYYEGNHKRTYSGWIDNYGDVHIAFYDHETKEIQSTVVMIT